VLPQVCDIINITLVSRWVCGAVQPMGQASVSGGRINKTYSARLRKGMTEADAESRTHPSRPLTRHPKGQFQIQILGSLSILMTSYS